MTSKTIKSAGYFHIESWVTDMSKYGKPDKKAMEAWVQDAELPSQFFTIEEIH